MGKENFLNGIYGTHIKEYEKIVVNSFASNSWR